MLLGLAIGGTGWDPDTRQASPPDPMDAGRLRRLASEAERGDLDFVTLDDSMAPVTPPGPGRPHAVTALAALAPVTRTIGLVATVTTTYAEPFHVARALATLDHISRGRAGWCPRVAASAAEAAHFGPEPLAGTDRLRAESAEFTEVVTALWDSWQDDAVIRDTASGRFLDRAKVRPIDHVGAHFRIKGPAVVPRPPQGHPVLATRLGPHSPLTDVQGADLVFTEVQDTRRVRARVGTDARVIAEVEVRLDGDGADGRSERPGATDRFRFTGSAAELAATLEAVSAREPVDGFHLRPAALPGTVERLVQEVVPLLRRYRPARPGPAGGSLRERLALPAPRPNAFPVRKAALAR
ncbi:LLM class flavin-dependent oxidoreductase [Streptomyces sp. NPDC002669]|uniref:LLM class flavin-dependent oxidoreductase n=1 Tax=Streptomyces sp. NPDC002669 TaxID=3364658 RepID=UPI0036AD698F